jgi:hypothetical protein
MNTGYCPQCWGDYDGYGQCNCLPATTEKEKTMKQYSEFETYRLKQCEELVMDAYCDLSKVRQILRKLYNDSDCPEQCTALTNAENKILKGLMALEGLPVDQIALGVKDEDEI